MCRQTTCPKCKKPTWAGCGAHIEQVLGSVPKGSCCQCNAAEGRAAKTTSGKTTSGKRGWFQRLLPGGAKV